MLTNVNNSTPKSGLIY